MTRMKSVLALTWRSRGRRHLIWTGAAYLVGFLIVLIVMPVAHAETYVTFGTYVGLFCSILFTIFGTILAFTQDYKEWIRHGTSRRTSLAGCTAMTLGLPLLTAAALLLLYLAENCLWSGLFRAAQEIAMGAWAWVGVMAAHFAAWLFGMLAAAVINRFGANGMIAIYFVYLGITLCLSRVMHLIAPFFAMYAVPILVGGAVILAIGVIFSMRSLYKTSI